MKKIYKLLYQSIPFKKYIYEGLKWIWTPPELIYRHLHFKGIFTVRTSHVNDFKMQHYGYQIENEIFWRGLVGGWEKKSISVWIGLCRMSSFILDIGANTGIYSLVAKAVNPNSHVYAFEPVKRVYSKLVQNCLINGYDIKCFELGVSNLDGQAVIYDTADEHILSVTLNRNLNDPQSLVIPTTVNTITLSSIIEQNKIDRVDLIKIDVETHEPEVLQGLGSFLSIYKPAILIEILNDDIAKRIEEIVQSNGYLYFNIDENQGIRRTDSISKSDYYNYLLCQPHTANALGLVS